jgi:dihydrofolate reductase
MLFLRCRVPKNDGSSIVLSPFLYRINCPCHHHHHHHHHHDAILKRYFSVKELSWCAPKDSPVRRHLPKSNHNNSSNEIDENRSNDDNNNMPFGIVAAMIANSRVIGVDGKLPWKHRLVKDRERVFERLTRDRILIVGRRTLLGGEEESQEFAHSTSSCPSLRHVHHAKYCIVVSTTIPNEAILQRIQQQHFDSNRGQNIALKGLKLATSLDEALALANDLAKRENEAGGSEVAQMRHQEQGMPSLSTLSSGENNLVCWVAGGERLYEEALKHKSAAELHLSVVHLDLDIDNEPKSHVAKFPAKYRWDHNYKETAKIEFDGSEDSDGGNLQPSFTYYVYKRIQRNK